MSVKHKFQMFGSASQFCYILLSHAVTVTKLCLDVAMLGPADPENEGVMTSSLRDPMGQK